MESCVTGRPCVGCLSRIVPEYSSAIKRTFAINSVIVVAISQILSTIHLNSNDFLPKGQTINAEYYLSLLVQLKKILMEKRGGKVTKGVLFLHDNVPTHRALATQKKRPIWASSVLITHPILRIWPRRTTACSLD